MPELYTNAAQTALASSCTSGATTISVVNAASFPASGNFRIVVDQEIMLVTAVSGTTFTVTRAVEAYAGIQTAVSHTSGAAVTHILTAASVALASAASPGGSSGQVQYNNGGSFGGAVAAVYATSGNLLSVTAQAVTDVPLVVEGAASQSGNLQEWHDSNGLTLAQVNPDGTVQVNWIFNGNTVTEAVSLNPNGDVRFNRNGAGLQSDGLISVRTRGATQTVIFDTNGGLGVALQQRTVVSSGDAAVIPLIIQGTGTQTADLQQWQDSTPTILSAIKASGAFKPVHLADANAPNDSIYYSTDASKLVYKDSGGTVNNLY